MSCHRAGEAFAFCEKLGLLAGLSFIVVLVIIGLSSGTAGEARTEEPPLFNMLVVGPTGSYNGTDVFYSQDPDPANLTLYVANVGHGNLTLRISATVTGDLTLETTDNTTVNLTSYLETLQGYAAKVAWSLNPGLGVEAPATFLVNMTVEATAWEGNVSPSVPVKNVSWRMRYLSATPGFELVFPDGPVIMQTYPDHASQKPFLARLHNVGNIPLNVRFPLFLNGTEFDACSIMVGSANHVVMPPLMEYTWMNTMSVHCKVGTPPGEYRLEVVTNISAEEDWVNLSELEPVMAYLNLTLMPYSEPALLWNRTMPFVDLGEEFTIELFVFNFGNGRDRIWVNLSLMGDFKEKGFKLKHPPRPVWLDPNEEASVIFTIEAPARMNGWTSNSVLSFKTEGAHHHYDNTGKEKAEVKVEVQGNAFTFINGKAADILEAFGTQCVMVVILLIGCAIVGMLNRFDPPTRKK